VGQAAFAQDKNTQVWLELGLPPLIDPAKEPPHEITGVKFERNHCDQEILTAECRRVWQITTIPDEVKLVILPSRGGRSAHYAPRGMTMGPQKSERFGAITESLLNYRGEIPGGARAYLEMRRATPNDRPAPVRISKVYWIGTSDQLAAAVKKGPPPTLEPGQSPNVEMVNLPANTALPIGTPIQFQIGGRWTPAMVYEAAGTTGDLIVQVFLARPGGLYKPWIADADRSAVRIEPDVLQAIRENAGQFAERLRSRQQQLTSMNLGAPQRLKAATAETISVGQGLLMFSLGNITALQAAGAAENGVVTVRSPKGGKESRVELINLYLDPEAPKVAAAVAATTTPSSAPSAGSPAASSEPRFRIWKDSTGKFEIEATLVSVENEVVRLIRKDKKEISLPLSRLSAADQKFIELSRTEASNPFDP